MLMHGRGSQCLHTSAALAPQAVVQLPLLYTCPVLLHLCCTPPPAALAAAQQQATQAACLDDAARRVAGVGRHKRGEGEAGNGVRRKLLQQIARLLQGFELQGVERVEHLPRGEGTS